MNNHFKLENKRYLNAQDVADMLEVSISMAYKIIWELNMELEKEKYITIAGKISKKYFESKICI